MKNINIKRNELDIIVTDLKPIEVSKIYTIKYFYSYLGSKKKELDKIICEIKKTIFENKNRIFEKGWHAAPLKYNIVKATGDLRTLSILNPLSMIEVYIFISIYNKEIISFFDNPVFSIRYHTKNNNLYYIKSKKGVVHYEHLSEDNKIDRLESSGAFYNIKPFVRLDQFFKSDKWFELNSKYRYFGKTDYKSCFDSIYTHVYNWIITDGVVDARNFRNNHILSVIDRLLQNMNSSITNGILVGPEFSRMIAEIILQCIDNEVYEELLSLNKINKIDYEICRYVDDIYIFTNNKDMVDKIMILYKEKASKYKLNLNELKSEQGSLPHIWNEWKADIKNFTEDMTNKLFHRYNDNKEDDENDYIIKGAILIKLDIMSNLKQQFHDIITNNYGDRQRMVAFIMRVILNQINRKDKKSIFGNSIRDKNIFKFYDLIFYFYSFAPTFANTEKLTSIIYMIEKEIEIFRNKQILCEVIQKYDYIIINNNLEDIIDFILLIATYNIELNNNIEKYLLKELDIKDNPLLYAVYLLYAKYNESYFTNIKSIIQDKIITNISNIKDDELFLHKEIWWILIFINCKYIDTNTQDKIKQKLIPKTDSKPCNKCKNLVIDFLINDNDNKFINWELSKEEFLETAAFNTYERTLFNNNNIDIYSEEDY